MPKCDACGKAITPTRKSKEATIFTSRNAADSTIHYLHDSPACWDKWLRSRLPNYPIIELDI